MKITKSLNLAIKRTSGDPKKGKSMLMLFERERDIERVKYGAYRVGMVQTKLHPYLHVECIL